MPLFDSIRELRNGKKYKTATISMSEGNSSEANPIIIAHENKSDKECETHILTQEEFDEQIRDYIAHLTRQLEDLTRLIQGMSFAHRPNLSPSAVTSGSSSAAGSSLDSEL